jgi:hypothetical protein
MPLLSFPFKNYQYKYNYFGKQYGSFLKIKHRSAISSNPTPRDILKGMQLTLFQRHLHTHVYCSTIHNSQAMEIAKIHHYQKTD